MIMLGRLICFLLRKHKRGKRDAGVPCAEGEQGYRCTRCGATHVRKLRKTKVKP